MFLNHAAPCYMTTGAPNIVRDKMATYCIYKPSLVRIDWQMMPQWSKTCIFGPFLWFLRHAAPCYMTTGAPNIVWDKISKYSIYKPSLVRIDWQIKCKNWHLGSFFIHVTPCYATLCHATWHDRRSTKHCQGQIWTFVWLYTKFGEIWSINIQVMNCKGFSNNVGLSLRGGGGQLRRNQSRV